MHHLFKSRFLSTYSRYFRPSLFKRSIACSYLHTSTDGSLNTYDYTRGRWLWNEELRRADRRRLFNVQELKSLAAAAVSRKLTHVGGFNCTSLVTMQDGFEMIARVPYPMTEPKQLLVASEVATMGYLRSCGIPIPEIYGYSVTSDNSAGTEYHFMEVNPAINLGDIWFELGETARTTIVRRLVELESRLFSLRFPASGSIYCSRDLDAASDRIKITSGSCSSNGQFCIVPDMNLALWYGGRLALDTFRGPYKGPKEVLEAGAKKEIAYLARQGRPLHPFQRLRREWVNYQEQSHLPPDLVPSNKANLAQPSIRHPDLQPNNVFVSRNLEIIGLIDWQHCTVVPLFLQAGIPGSLQDYGDSVSESLERPQLPANFDEQDEPEQLKQVLLLRKRQLHYTYLTETLSLNPAHGQVLMDHLSVLRRKLFRHASEPWEGDSSALHIDLVELTRRRTDSQFQSCLELVGVGSEGWVPTEQYDDARQREQQLKADTLQEAESEQERRQICDHWIFDDIDETAYM
ncbi:hypothetical protein K431DRAFT_340316 [Polychaeton citri CBS 116435]|uniref:Aminoglycoside phosphotransferase domain-containing protein n=1 Tax=Polychaeton citri CBS 116435 TaxID=1314669 RepID=A0A9P4Q429_9PEZI|nr:hypothetical protein K431DRAFT_340316 [Polychaeton citri CBS 116435]